jgi:putative CocE/NonD family hydrolase
MLREDARRLGLREASDRLEAAWQNIRAQSAAVPYAQHAAIADPALPAYVRDWFAHRELDEYWKGFEVRIDQVNVPALHLAGWFDTYLEGSIAGYLALRAHAATEHARQNQYLIAGPWVHIPWGDRAGDATHGDAANLDTDSILLKWFDHWLKNSASFEGERRIRYFALGKNEWRSVAEWPGKAEFALYLHSGGNANSRKGDGRLTQDAPASDEPRDVFVYDPEVPVFAPGGPQAMSGTFDQAAIELGNNLLVYTSEPAVRDAEIFGHPRAQIYAATSAPHADLTAKLVRVTANGRAEFVCIGIARSSWLFRDSGYSADAVHLWEFALEPTAFVLVAGERLRLEIAGSAFPLYDRNPSTDVPPQLADNSNWARSTHQILHTTGHPSAFYLPIAGASPW